MPHTPLPSHPFATGLIVVLQSNKNPFSPISRPRGVADHADLSSIVPYPENAGHASSYWSWGTDHANLRVSSFRSHPHMSAGELVPLP